MKLTEAREIVDRGHIMALNYGPASDDYAFVEIELGETDYAVTLGKGRPIVSCSTWDEAINALGISAYDQRWVQVTSDQEDVDTEEHQQQRP
jgi:hypothetical protein